MAQKQLILTGLVMLTLFIIILNLNLTVINASDTTVGTGLTPKITINQNAPKVNQTNPSSNTVQNQTQNTQTNNTTNTNTNNNEDTQQENNNQETVTDYTDTDIDTNTNTNEQEQDQITDQNQETNSTDSNQEETTNLNIIQQLKQKLTQQLTQNPKTNNPSTGKKIITSTNKESKASDTKTNPDTTSDSKISLDFNYALMIIFTITQITLLGVFSCLVIIYNNKVKYKT
jgi:hypothetical protein